METDTTTRMTGVDATRLPLMIDEAVDVSLGEKSGLRRGLVPDGRSLVLTNRRVVSLAKQGNSWEVTSLALEDARLAQVRLKARGVGQLLRVALLFAGAGAALATIDLDGLSWGLATVLALGGGYHLLRFLRVASEVSIYIRAGTEQLEMSVASGGQGAHEFVNRFFHLKAGEPLLQDDDAGDVQDGEASEAVEGPEEQSDESAVPEPAEYGFPELDVTTDEPAVPAPVEYGSPELDITTDEPHLLDGAFIWDTPGDDVNANPEPTDKAEPEDGPDVPERGVLPPDGPGADA